MVSSTHNKLVRKIIGWVKSQHEVKENLIIYHDNPAPIKAEKPKKIGGSIPDVYAHSIDGSFVVIGEAKTIGDLEKDHTIMQIRDYLNYLNKVPVGIFVMAVPLWSEATCINMILNIKKELNVTSVKHQVLIG